MTVLQDSGALPTRTKVFYGLGEAATSTAQTAVDTFLLFFLTGVVGLSGTLAGAAMFVALLVDGIADPLIGYASDNARSRYGRRHPFMFAGLVPLAIAVGLIYSTPHFGSQWLTFAYVVAALLLLRVALSVYALPYIALGAELTPDYRERSVVQSYRSAFWICAYALTMFLGLGVFLNGPNGLLERAAYVGFGWAAALIALIVGLCASAGTYAARPAVPKQAQHTQTGVGRLVREVSDVMHNPSFFVLFLAVLTFWVAQGVTGSLWIHASKYFWELPPSVMQAIPIIGSIGFAIGIPLTTVALARYEKLTVALVSLAVIGLVQTVPAWLRVLHWLPPSGMPLYVVLGSLQFVSGITSTSLGIAFPSMMADAADEHELLFGSRREGLYFAGLTLSAKAASGAGSFIAGLGLDAIGFPSDLASAVPISAETVRNLGLVWGPGAGLISLLSVVALMSYRLDRGEHARIQQELQLRAVAERSNSEAP